MLPFLLTLMLFVLALCAVVLHLRSSERSVIPGHVFEHKNPPGVEKAERTSPRAPAIPLRRGFVYWRANWLP